VGQRISKIDSPVTVTREEKAGKGCNDAHVTAVYRIGRQSGLSPDPEQRR
jgi:hypothetical protein